MENTRVSDIIEIQQLLVSYSEFIDTRQWDRLDDLFLPGCILDYSATGSIVGPWPEHRAMYEVVMESFSRTQHLLGLPFITLAEDTAAARTACFNPMVTQGPGGFFVGLWYLDDLRRTDTGWKFAHRVQELAFMQPARRDD